MGSSNFGAIHIAFDGRRLSNPTATGPAIHGHRFSNPTTSTPLDGAALQGCTHDMEMMVSDLLQLNPAQPSNPILKLYCRCELCMAAASVQPLGCRRRFLDEGVRLRRREGPIDPLTTAVQCYIVTPARVAHSARGSNTDYNLAQQ